MLPNAPAINRVIGPLKLSMYPCTGSSIVGATKKDLIKLVPLVKVSKPTSFNTQFGPHIW